MRFTDDLVLRLCAAILARWKAKGLIRPKASDDALLSRMTAEIHNDIRREAELDREAEALLEKHMGKIEGTEANSRILFQKKKLSKEKEEVQKQLEIAAAKIAAHREAKAVLDSYAAAEEAVDAFARDRISRLSRKVPEGGREWEILYRKYFEEEITRRKL
ncbi:MAG: hypothetical protein B7Z62_03760 [Deltaproteobacteria bacterium 37-65-8]|nr:MAG: hypothetical protein B7Z62_03760 [Deltaproteobacteria bacterium 37-65-8]